MIKLKFGELTVITKNIGDLPEYSGDYEVTPAMDSQTLETKDTWLSKDVTVLKIPVSQVSNATGVTVTIGTPDTLGE